MDQLLAAVDLGSNSFRLSIGRIVQQDGTPQIYQIDRLKETVRLAAGLDSEKRLGDEAIDRAIAVLERFGDRLRSFHPNRSAPSPPTLSVSPATPATSCREPKPPWAFPSKSSPAAKRPA